MPLWVLGILIAFIVTQNAVPLLLAPFFDIPQPDLSRYDVIRGNAAAAITYALLLPLVAAVPEQILYRGFPISRLTEIFGNRRNSMIPAVFAQSVIFGAAHFQWGLGGGVATAIMGAVCGAAFIACGRNLWIVILASRRRARRGRGAVVLLARESLTSHSEIAQSRTGTGPMRGPFHFLAERGD